MPAGVRVGFRVRAVDGECQPVAGLEVAARYRYPSAPPAWGRQQTDGEGYARFDDEHPEPPLEARLFVAGRPCTTIAPVEPGGCYLLEL